MKNRMIQAISILAITGLLSSCNESSGGNWPKAVPPQTSFIILPDGDASVSSVLHSRYAPFLQKVSASAFQLVAKIDSTAPHSMPVHSILLYPGTRQKFEPVWITKAPKKFKHKLQKKYDRRFAQNKYRFHGVTILNLQFQEQHIFVAGLGNLFLISKSSLAVENAIRSYRGQQPRANLADLPKNPASMVMNTPALGQWISRLARVQYHPVIKGVFKGTSPASLALSSKGDSSRFSVQLSGTVSLNDGNHSALVNALSFMNEPITLDQYISSDAAGFGLFRARANRSFAKSLADTTQTDAYLMGHPAIFKSLSQSLDSKIGLEMFSRSGPNARSEHLFVRALQNPDKLQDNLDVLSRNNTLKKFNDSYFVQSTVLARLLGSRLCDFKNFYVGISGDIAIIARRQGLIQRVAADHKNRQTIIYEAFYRQLKKQLPPAVSSLIITGEHFNTYLRSLLTSNNYAVPFISSFNHIALATQVNPSRDRITLDITTANNSGKSSAYRSRWIYNTAGSRLTGPPALGNLSGGLDDEVVFAQKNGRVYALSSDGTFIRRFKTKDEQPIGTPVIYDWYGTGQNVILLAAGNKIYGWDKNGDLLPRFPFELSEKITTPLRVADVNHNKLPNAIVATADRKLHVLDGRGQDIAGWPATVNAAINSTPLIDYYHGKSSIVVFASNTAHGWDASGTPLPGYPHFINSEFRGSPAKYKHTILGGAVDGKLYAVGGQLIFNSSAGQVSNTSTKNNYVELSDSPLYGAPVVEENHILTASTNGSVFLQSTSGRLQLTKNMGQQAATDWSPLIVDLDGNGKKDIITLSKYGRLFVWQFNGHRLTRIPKKAMHHVAIGDLEDDGLIEVIAQTDRGVQCWTINHR